MNTENKITKEVRYKNMSFTIIREVKGLKMYIDEQDSDYCIIVDKDDTVLFEIIAKSGQNQAWLEDAILPNL